MVIANDDYSRPPKDKAELLQRINREWSALERAFEGLSDSQMSLPDEGGWSIKDNLAHLAAWEHFMRFCYFRKLPAAEVLGIDESILKQLDENGVNAVLYQRDKDRSTADILAAIRKEHEQLLADLAKMSFEQIMEPLDPNDPQKRPLLGWILGNTYDHYKEHRARIEKYPR